MNVKTIAFFNNKGGVGKTSLVYHLAHMFADLNVRVVAVDLDPQANLTAAFLDEDRLQDLWLNNDNTQTVYGSLAPLVRALGDIANPHIEIIEDRLALIPGDLALSGFEDQLSEVWPKCLDADERAFRVISAFWRITQRAARSFQAEIALIDLGPNLGAINRAGLIASDYVVVPLSPDLFSLQGLRNLGPRLRRWRDEWGDRLKKNPAQDLELPKGQMYPVGYVVLQHAVRLDRPVKADDRWIARIPESYREDVLNEQTWDKPISIETDPHRLAMLKNYRSLMPLAQEAHKPMFRLKAADGAIGAHWNAVNSASKDFHDLAFRIADKVGLSVSP
jgi:cellulose biosynthesis protein BcsQ